ncbi:MAG: Nramp family divalent metal transporter [Planctomycetes bacterium]|nr:Nramp family divalent metal transporter [Planctomycetota bacterium]
MATAQLPDHDHANKSLPEMHGSVPVPKGASWLRRLFAFSGPAYLVSVGYMDPGNWATDLAGGASFGYQLVWVLVMSNLMAVLLQTLSARLGVVTGKDLAQACRDYYPSIVVWPLWLLCEVAIVACDLAEVLGAAIGLKLLFGVPVLGGVLLTSLDVLLLLALSRLGMRRLEAFIIVLVATIGACFAVEILLSKPDLLAVLKGVIPRDGNGSPSLFGRTPDGGISVLGLHGSSLYIAVGILGATVMPHNLYLHSSLVQTRTVGRTTEGRRQACRMNLIDSVVALNAALFVNAAILVLAAAAFHKSGHSAVASLEEAHTLLAPLLGTSLASVLFALALLCAGQSSTITGTLAGQIVMEGFLKWRIRPWLRRLISRSLAIVPAAVVILWRGESAVDGLLVLSQVVLSLQLSFAVIPLVSFTSDRRRMGEFVNRWWVTTLAVLVAATIAGLNLKLATEAISAWLAASQSPWLRILIVPPALALVLLLAFVTLAPLLRRWFPGMMRHEEEGTAPTIPMVAGIPPMPVEAAAAHKRIAVALELGPADAAVLRHVLGMASATGATLILLHVAESAGSRYHGGESLDQESRDDQAALAIVAEQCRERGLKAEALLGFGDPAKELARLVEESGADLLVTGAHGHRLLGDLLFGATASGLRHMVSIPMLTVPSTE